MPNRVNVDVHVRDLTRPELERMRRGFNNLGRDLDRVLVQRTRQNFERLSQSVSQARRDLTALRGAIPEDEFLRMDDAIRRASRRMQRGFGRVGQRAMRAIAADVQEVAQSFRDLDRSASIRIRVDEAALRRMARERARMAREAEREAARRSQSAEQAARDARDYRRRWVRAFLGRPLRIPTEPDGTFWQRRVRGMSRLLTSPFRQLAGLVSGILQDGIGQGIVGAVKAGGPVAGTILAGIIVSAVLAALSVIGAALSGLLVTALGLGFVGIGAVSAATSDEVQRNWKEAVKNMKADFKSVGEPLVPLVHETVHDLENLVDRVAPKLKTAFEDAVPATRKFKDALLAGLESFGQEMFQPIMDAWNVFAPVFGEEWKEFMHELGAAFADMAKLVQEHPEEIAAALGIVFDVITLLVKTVTFFGEVWVFSMRAGTYAVGVAIEAWADFEDAVNQAVSSILHGIAFMAQAIPGIGDKAKNAAEAFDEWRATSTDDLHAMAQSAFDYGLTLDHANRKRQLDADISMWQHKLDVARADLKKTTDKKARAQLELEIGQLQRKLRDAQRELNSMDGRVTRTTWVLTTVNRQVFERVEASSARLFAHGGVRGLSAAATGGVRSNMTLVGEQGPELIDLAPGSHVRSNPDTRRLLGQGAGGGGVQRIELSSAGGAAADLVVELLRSGVKSTGGNVQLSVMGKN